MRLKPDRFLVAMRMLPEAARAEVRAQIEQDLPEPKAGRRTRKPHNHILHLPHRRCQACKLEILGNVAADLGRLDVVQMVN
jgi:hypothetical protein